MSEQTKGEFLKEKMTNMDPMDALQLLAHGVAHIYTLE